ncbi:hypothetical protein CMI37_08110 [Candidatus Pacearchaeota archaeon]|nr:hypothetical protein [Candidatus Pacearchaeota archaeon]|tara:strand:+ start:2098 stop:3297 length:1200 start_codon:yes stop_codon:yes gene_type:complete
MKFFQKDELKLLWPFYLDALISPLLFFLPVFIVVFLAGLELSFFQIGILVAVTPLFQLIFEIPTGAIADLYGRKFSVLFGYLLEGLVVLSLFFVRDYYLMLGAFALWGFASTLSSGSKEAWVIDLVEKKSKSLSKSFFHKSQSFDAFALVISGIIGAFIVKKFGMSSIWLFAFFSFVISSSILLFAKENFVKRKIKIRQSFSELIKQTKETFSYGYRHHVLYYYLIASFVFTLGLAFSMGITWTPLLLELNFPEHYFGYMWSAIAMSMMIAPIFSNKLLKERKEKKFIMISLALSALVTFFILFPKEWIFALVVLLTIQFFMILRMPASKMYFHRFIPSKLRATMGSVDAMLSSLAGIIAVPIVGYLIDVIGARYTILIYAPITILVIFIYSRIKEGEI